MFAYYAKWIYNFIKDKETFTIETNAADYAIAAILSQNSRPVVFFSRSLTEFERRQSSVEQEASAIVESFATGVIIFLEGSWLLSLSLSSFQKFEHYQLGAFYAYSSALLCSQLL